MANKEYVFYLDRNGQGDIDVKSKPYKFEGDIADCKNFCEKQSIATKPDLYINRNKQRLIGTFKEAFEEWEAQQAKLCEEVRRKVDESISIDAKDDSRTAGSVIETSTDTGTVPADPPTSTSEPNAGSAASTSTPVSSGDALTDSEVSASDEHAKNRTTQATDEMPDVTSEPHPDLDVKPTSGESRVQQKVTVGYKIKGTVQHGVPCADSQCTKVLEYSEKLKNEERAGYIVIKGKNETEDAFNGRRAGLKCVYNTEAMANAHLQSSSTQSKKTSSDGPIPTGKSPTPSNQQGKAQHSTMDGYSGQQNAKSVSQQGNYSISNGSPQKPQPANPQIERMLRELSDNVKNLKSQIERIGRVVADVERQTSGTSKISQTLNDYNYYFNSLKDEVKGTAELVQKKTRRIEDVVGESIDPLKEQLSQAITATETMEGKLASVEEKLSAKGVRITRESNPTNADAKVIANAKTLAIRLIESLTDAATAYADNKEVIENAADVEARINAEIEERVNAAREAGKKDILMEILEKYEDIDAMFDDPNNAILVAFLKNNGLEKGQDLAKGSTIEIKSEEDLQKLGAIAKGVTNVGKYSVERSLFKFNGKTFDAVVRIIPNNSDEGGCVSTDVND